MALPYIRTDDGLTIFVKGSQYDVSVDHVNYNQILEALNENDEDRVKDLVDVSKSINQYGKGVVVVENGNVYYKGEVLHNSLTRRILSMMREGFDIEPMKNFLENLMQNPSKRAVDELYTFLEQCKLPITPDGHFLAYKRVRKDYTDIFSGTVDNSVGATPWMERNKVDDDKERVCSQGLHFCSIGYLPYFGTDTGHRTMIVKINPAEVVSIPVDHNHEKGRCWRYEVVGEHKDGSKNEAFDRTVHNVKTNSKDHKCGSVPYDKEDRKLLSYVEILRDELDLAGVDLLYKRKNGLGFNKFPKESNIQDDEVVDIAKIVRENRLYAELYKEELLHILDDIAFDLYTQTNSDTFLIKVSDTHFNINLI